MNSVHFTLLLCGIKMKRLNYRGKNLEIDGKSIKLNYNIKDARIIDNKAIVIFEFDELADKYKQFQNCIAMDANGDKLWVAEHPTNQTADTYLEFMNKADNRLWNFACFVCTIDFATGKLKNAEFTK